MKVLIAEDDLTSRRMLQAVLSKWGYEVATASDGSQAWAMLKEETAPCLAVVDWEMPGLDGVALCRRLRARTRKEALYLILLTSRRDPGDIVMGLEAGADDYITKPWNNAELQARLNAGRRILNLQSQIGERERLQGVLEMAGAVCHELNQPLQIVLGYLEILQDTDPENRQGETIEGIKKGVLRIGELTGRIMKITRYEAKPYLEGRIVDIDKASE